MTCSAQSVTVVIPTAARCRSELRRAVVSALAEPEVTEVVVVVDAAGERPDEIEVIDPRVSRLDGEVSGLPGVLRSLGTEAATTDWVAYLDDDDEFLPGKLAAQLALAASQDLEIVSCLSELVDEDGVVVERSVPRVPYTTGERLDEYLFARRSLSLARNSMFTPTLLVRRSSALEIGWSELPRHQDWEFLLRAHSAGMRVGVVGEVKCRVQVPQDGGVSASADPAPAIKFARNNRHVMSDRAYVEFLVSQALRYSLQSMSIRSVREVASMCPSSPLPSVRSLCIAFLGPFFPLARRARSWLASSVS